MLCWCLLCKFISYLVAWNSIMSRNPEQMNAVKNVNQFCFRFLISLWIPKTFVVKVKSCSKSGRIFELWSSQISGVQAPKNLYISDHAHLKAHYVAKYREATPTIPKIIGVHLLKFKPILDPIWKKMWGWPQSSVGGALVRLGHSLAHVKIWRCSTP